LRRYLVNERIAAHAVWSLDSAERLSIPITHMRPISSHRKQTPTLKATAKRRYEK